MVVVEDLHRTCGSGPTAVQALRGVSFAVPRGRPVAVRGRSGPGRTTLLNLVGGLDTPDADRVTVDGSRPDRLTEKPLLELRRVRAGFVFQRFGLLPVLTAAENAGVPPRLRRAPAAEREERVACCCPWPAAPTTPGSGPASSPGDSSSASPSPAPWPTGPARSSPTNPPAGSTATPAGR